MASPHCVPLVMVSPYTQATLSLSHSRPPSSFDVPYLRAQLDKLETTLSTLLDQRLALTARLTEAVALTSPIRLLSSELLSAIFIAATTTSQSSLHDGPVLLSTLMLVCKQWRDICLCTPELWSRISISPNEPESLDKARRRLIRSKAVALDIFLDFSPRSSFSAQAPSTYHPTHTPDHLLKTSLLLLRPTISRWRTFVLLVPYRPQATAALALCSSPAPMLETLTIQVSNPMLHAASLDWDRERPNGGRSTLPFRGCTPRLRECSLTSFWCERPEDLTPLITAPDASTIEATSGSPSRWCESMGPRTPFAVDIVTERTRMIFPGVGHRLTKLKLIGFWNDFAPNVEEMIGVLRQCPLLEDLSIRNMSDVDAVGDELTAPTASPVVLRYLRRASFYYSGVTRTCALLHRTALPALECLELSFLDNITACLKHLKDQTTSRSGYDRDYSHYIRGYHEPIDTSHFPLKCLRIEASFFNELKLMRLLRRLPTIEKLELVDVEDVSSNLLKGLSAPVKPNEWILPQLKTLNLEGCTSIEWDDLKVLVESRLPSSSASTSAAAHMRHRGSLSSSYSIKSGVGISSSASDYARGRAMKDTPYVPTSIIATSDLSSDISTVPNKLTRLDLTRCSQISRERVQWLRMYVPDVLSENAKGPWAGAEDVV